MYWLYNILLFLAAPIWLPWMLVRTFRRKERPIWRERMGNYDIPMRGKRPRVWVHAVSVGEVVAISPVLREIRSLAPEAEIVLSVTTSSGHQTAREKAQGLFDHLVYFPIDVAKFQLSAVARVRPSVVVIAETELWLNFLWAAKVVGATTILVNGRISDRSFPRSLKLKRFYAALLGYVDRALMQTPLDVERLEALGGKNVEALGNCKFDQAVEGLDADPVAWRKELKIPSDAKVVVVGSTRGENEEKLVIEALADPRLSQLNVVHAPRHLERVPDLAEAVRLRFGGVALRSKGETGRYLIVDTYGELSKLYSAADVVVIGGGFDDLGGQNLIQPLAHGKPVLHGPHMQNFQEATTLAQRAGASITCATAQELAEALAKLLSDDEERKRMGEAAAEMVRANLGASKRYAEAVVSALPKK